MLLGGAQDGKSAMCGIAGEFQTGRKRSGADWPAIAGLMSRRGPDDEGFWTSDDQLCTMAFRRLSILDLSPAGHQPMLGGSGRFALVFNGEIYNFRELRSELEGRGISFKSTGDTEVVLHALAQWGTKALSRFNGIFALAFYDDQEKSLLLARDHAGIKPLYYLETAQGIAFGSQFDQMLAHPWSAGLPICRDALAIYMRIAYIPAPYGILAGTHMIEPGAWIKVDAQGSIRRGRHFEIPIYAEASLRADAAVEAVDSALDRSVKRQLVSDVPVAAFLSGGIDSPLVVSKMRRLMDRDLRAFTIGTAGDALDESPDAAAYAEQLGVTHVVEHVRPEQILGMLSDVIQASAEPFGDYSIFPTMLVSRLAAQDFKVVLSGDGGDELFWGYVARMSRLIENSGDLRKPYPIRFLESQARKLLGVRKPGGLLRARSLGQEQLARHTHLAAPILSSVFPNLPAWPSSYASFDFHGWQADPTAHWLRWNEFTTHLPMVLLKVDRASMYHSLEVRVPMLDKDVIETALKVDWRSCLDLTTRTGKLPLRHALSRAVSHQTSTKRGFEVPMGQWLRGPLREIFEEAVLSRTDIAGLAVDRKAMRAVFQDHLDGSTDLGWGLWPILSLSLWERHHLARRHAGGSIS